MTKLAELAIWVIAVVCFLLKKMHSGRLASEIPRRWIFIVGDLEPIMFSEAAVKSLVVAALLPELTIVLEAALAVKYRFNTWREPREEQGLSFVKQRGEEYN